MNMLKELKKSDEYTFSSRLQRLKEIKSLPLWSGSYDLLLFGGLSCSFALYEIPNAYINGNFLSCIFLTQIFFENTLAAYFCMRGDDELAGAGFAKLVERCKSEDYIDGGFAAKLDVLRKVRNSYTHFHAMSDKRGLINRIYENSASPDDLLMRDAKFAVELISEYIMRKRP